MALLAGMGRLCPGKIIKREREITMLSEEEEEEFYMLRPCRGECICYFG